jgi:hypothetical protein
MAARIGSFRLWLLIHRIEKLSAEEIQRRRDAWAPPERPSKMG